MIAERMSVLNGLSLMIYCRGNRGIFDGNILAKMSIDP